MPIEPYFHQSNPLRRNAHRILPSSLKAPISRALAPIEQAWSRARGLPPRSLRLQISPDWFDFRASGRDQLEYFTELAALQSGERVLDIACGVGRIAIPLTSFLTKEGSYEGFDVYKPGIDWCAENITSIHPNFCFQVADVLTPFSPDARYSAEEYSFPYDDGSFDFAYAGSIFTHLVKPAAANYLDQAARVLRTGGRLVSTWNVYDTSAAASFPQFLESVEKFWPYERPGHRLHSLDYPELNVAYEIDMVRTLQDEAGLKLLQPFRLDASYCPARIPSNNRAVGMHLYHTISAISLKI